MAGTADDAAAHLQRLRQRCRTAPTRELVELIGDHGSRLTLPEVRQILLNPYATAEVLDELAAVRPLLSTYEVRSALARHHRTPATVTMRLLSGLFWRDLLEIVLDARLAAGIRKGAEAYLLRRLPRLTTGERISLARRASGEVAARLGADPTPRVVAALLDNPRLVETAVAALVAKSSAPRILQLVAAHPRWSRRREVRRGLALNPSTPFRALFAILPTLTRRDLAAVAALENHSTLVRNRARELLSSVTDDIDQLPIGG